MLRLDISPKFRVHREADEARVAASETVRAARERARKLARLRTVAGATLFAAAAPFFAFKAQLIGHAPTSEPAALVAKAPATPPAAIAQAQKPMEDRIARDGVDFTATSTTCSATAKAGEEGSCAPAKSSARNGAKDGKKAKNAKGSKNGKSAKGDKPPKNAGAAGGKEKKASTAGARG